MRELPSKESELDQQEIKDLLIELVTQTARIARAIENQQEARPSGQIRYTDSTTLEEMRAEILQKSHGPEKPSWHQNLRYKRVSIPAATGTSIVIYGVAEVIRLIAEGRFHLW
jgi:hypothetical protein